MAQRIIMALMALAIFSLAAAPAGSFPIGFSAVGGIGAGYYDMAALNRHLQIVSQDSGLTTLDELLSGVNFRIEGRVWLFDLFAATGGFEHFWGATESQGSTSTLSYLAPSDVYTVGAIVAPLRIENVLNLCAGSNLCFAKSVYGTNEVVARRLSEFKGEGRGCELYAEAHTNFLNPIEVGFQLGYRWLALKTFTDKYGNVASFESGIKMEIDYSGAFFYFTTAIRL
ncbi:MAG: hypothetical protein WC674_02130 [Candidatus Krumholzibacteriia bacterium]